MNRNKLKVAAAVLATCSMAGEAWAETVCAGAQDLTALQVASVQQQLMVAALACETDDVTLYNSFVTTYQQDLITSDEALQAWFLRRAPRTGTDDYHAFKTRMANHFSVRSADDRPGFCRSADRLFHQALAGRKQSLAAFALSQPMAMDADYTVCGDTVKGESYAYAAVKEEPKEEKPVVVQPQIAAAPPPKPVLPQPPAVVVQHDDANGRAYAENVAPAPAPRSYGYGAPMQSQQSSCTRMSNGYLDCYYGAYHYYRDPYGRFLPPPPSYPRGY
jgi:hypothetical protein